MKFLLGVDIGGYSFDKAAKTVTLTGLNPLALEQVLLITNVDTNTIIYQFNKVGYGGTISGNIITLDFDTTSMSNSDRLQIFIEYQSQLPLPNGAATESTLSGIKTNTDKLDVNLSTRLSESDFDTKTGSLTEAAPTSDTASSGLNGRLQRIAQNVTTLNTTSTNRTQKTQITDGTRDGTIKAASTLPLSTDTALVVTQRESITVGNVTGIGGIAGQKQMFASFPVVIASDQSGVATKFDSSNLSAFGTLEASELTPLIQGNFAYGINKQTWAYSYVFTVTAPAVAPVSGDIYTNSNNSFVIIYASGTTIYCNGTGDPSASGTLVRATGSGSTPITYSAFTLQAGVIFGAGASVDISNSRLTIQSGTNSAGYAYLLSKKVATYRAGEGNMVRLTSIFTTGVVNNIQVQGIGSINNNSLYEGYFFGYNGTSFGIAHYIRGVANWTAKSSWNGDSLDGTNPSTFNWDVTKGTPVMIKYPYLGYGDILFYVQNVSTGAWILVHTIRYANTTNATQLSNPNLNVLYYTINSGNTSNITMYSGSVGVFSSGEVSGITNPKDTFDSVSQAVTNVESCLLNVRNAISYNGVPNKSSIRLVGLSLGLKEATVVTVRFKIGSIIGGTPSWTAIDGTISNNGLTIASGNSPASYDVAGTTVTGGRQIFGRTIGASGSVNENLIPFQLFILPGEQLTISAVATGNSTVGITLSTVNNI